MGKLQIAKQDIEDMLDADEEYAYHVNADAQESKKEDDYTLWQSGYTIDETGKVVLRDDYLHSEAGS